MSMATLTLAMEVPTTIKDGRKNDQEHWNAGGPSLGRTIRGPTIFRAATARTVESPHKAGVATERRFFLDSDDEDGDASYDSLVAECTALQQRSAQFSTTGVREDRKPFPDADLFGQGKTALEVTKADHERADNRFREQTQLHRLLGDYMLSATGDRIMELMEEAVNDSCYETNNSIQGQKSAHVDISHSDDEDLDLSEMFKSMEAIEQYIAQN